MGAVVKPEETARRRIDAALAESGWAVQAYAAMNLSAGAGPHRAVAVAEFAMAPGHGTADYLRFLNGQAVGALEAKKEGGPW